VLDQGRLRQVGAPREVLCRPANALVARFMGCRNVYAADVAGSEVCLSGGLILRTDRRERGSWTAVIRPEDIRLSRKKPPRAELNCFQATVERISIAGAWAEITALAPPVFTVFVTRPSIEEMRLAPGQSIWLSFPSSAVHLC
jgi:ABC-type Fe3+/spermidine/putrescine transport system ATPase subunit